MSSHTTPIPNYVIDIITEHSARLHILLEQARTASVVNGGEWYNIIGKIAVEASSLCVCTIDLDKYIEQDAEIESL